MREPKYLKGQLLRYQPKPPYFAYTTRNFDSFVATVSEVFIGNYSVLYVLDGLDQWLEEEELDPIEDCDKSISTDKNKQAIKEYKDYKTLMLENPIEGFDWLQRKTNN